MTLLEDLDADIARLQVHHPAASARDIGSQATARRQRLPDHLPREDMAIDIDEQVCPCCGNLDPVPRDDLALAIERRVVAIFAHQHMGKQSRARQSLGDGALGRGRLMDRPAGTATIFGTPDAKNPQPRRHEVEHLADRLADNMERAAAAGTDLLINIDRHVFARQMVGKSLPACRSLRTDIPRRCCRMVHLQAGNIGVEVFQSESKLVAIDAFRAPSELRALEPPNDELESLDLGLRLGKL
jgi:hypothetical protein